MAQDQLFNRIDEAVRWQILKGQVDDVPKGAPNVDWESFHKATDLMYRAIGRFGIGVHWQILKDQVDEALKWALNIDWESFHKALDLMYEAIEG